MIRFRYCQNWLMLLIVIVSGSGMFLVAWGEPERNNTEFTFGKNGIESIQMEGQELLDRGGIRLRRVIFLQDDRSKHPGKKKPVESSYDQGQRRMRRKYPWGEISCRYETDRSRLSLQIKVTNRSDKTLHRLDMELLKLRLEGDVSTGQERNNTGEPTVIPAEWDEGVMVLCNLQIDRPLRLSLKKSQENQVEVLLRAGGDKMVYDRLYLRRPVKPGESDSYEVSFRFAPAGTNPLDLGADIFKKFRKAHPRLLEWSDNSPITRHFFGGGMPKKKVLQYFKDPDSVELPETTEKYRTKILSGIDGNIAAAKEIGAQAIIVWDIEGNAFPHPTTYIGDPRMTKVFAPRMNEVADEVFARIREAGLQAGICIRPTQIKYLEDEGKVAHRHTPVLKKYPEDPVFHQLDAKITYAKERWGCTVFYIDTPFFWRPRGPRDEWSSGMIRADVWKKLLRKHPDILLIPEFHYLEQRAYVVPYAEYDMGFRGTSEYARRVYPEAWTVAVVEDADPYMKWNLMVRNVRKGDALMTFSYGLTRNARAIKHIYKAAELLDAGVPDAVADADAATLVQLLQSDELEIRFHAVRKLAESEPTTAEPALLKVMLNEKRNFVVRKNAVTGLGHLEYEPAIKKLIRLLRIKKPDLRYFAAEALGRIGEPALTPVLKLVDERQKYGIIAAGMIGSSRAVPKLADIAAPDSKSQKKRAAYDALGRIGGEKATTVLINCLKNEAGIYARCAAAKGLAKTGRPEARKALKEVRAEARKSKKLNHLAWCIGRALKNMK